MGALIEKAGFPRSRVKKFLFLASIMYSTSVIFSSLVDNDLGNMNGFVEEKTGSKLDVGRGIDSERGERSFAYSDDMISEWNEHMEGFVPQLMVTIPIDGQATEYFFEDVIAEDVKKKSLLRGGFFSTMQGGNNAGSIDLRVTDPKGEIAYDKKGSSEGLYHFHPSQVGVYTISVTNTNWMETQHVTLTLGKGSSQKLTEDHLSTVEEHIDTIDHALKDIQSEATFLWIRQKSHFNTVKNVNTRIFWFSFLEFLILCGVSAFQVYYVKTLLSDRRSF